MEGVAPEFDLPVNTGVTDRPPADFWVCATADAATDRGVGEIDVDDAGVGTGEFARLLCVGVVVPLV